MRRAARLMLCSTAMCGTVFAERYQLGGVLGAGGMGIVYEARDLLANRDVAIKRLRPDRARDAVARSSLVAESQAAFRVEHRNVVPVIDGGESDGEPYIVMELVRGKSLRDLLCENGSFGIRRASSLVHQVLLGLHAIHTAGFVHGDVKADNIIVGDGDRVTLIDLGLIRSHTDPEAASEGTASGTPEYMAPELVRGERALPESDLYAVGVLLYELLTGVTPFAGGTSTDIFRRHLDDDVVPAGLRCPVRGIPRRLDEVMLRALEKVPSARFRSARAFALTLAAATPAQDPISTPQRTTVSIHADAATLACSPAAKARFEVPLRRRADAHRR